MGFTNDAEKSLAAADPVMAKLIERVGPLQFAPRRLPTFQSLVRSIIYQQLSGRVAEVILDRFIALFGDRGFPAPHDVSTMDFEKMRGAGLSRPKTAYIKEVAEMTLKGMVPSVEANVCHFLSRHQATPCPPPSQMSPFCASNTV